MSDEIALEIIYLYNTEETVQSTLRTIWQEVSDLMSPVDDQITTKRTLGQREEDLYDETAKFDCMDMINGLSSAMLPSGQEFFGFQPENTELEQIDVVRRYLAYATEKTHQEIYKSNFLLQFNEALRTMSLFGPCALYSEFDTRKFSLNYRTQAIGSYQILEDSHSNVDTILIKVPLTARQAKQQFIDERGVSPEKLGKTIVDCINDEKRQNTVFDFIHCVRPRKDRSMVRSDAMNMPYESIYVNVQEKTVIDEGGYEEFCYGVARWMWSARMKYGTGQGMMVLRSVRSLQQMQKDLLECGNKWNNPPLEVLDSFEGVVNKRPGAMNRVMQMGSIKGIENAILGNFPITKEMLEFTQERVHKAFFRDIFVQLADLTGDRRTTVEIIERLKEGLRRLSLPVSRIYSELLNPVISRSLLLLIRNGVIEPPPQELQGRGFGIEYKGELALALRNQQAKGFMQFAGFIGQLTPFFPDAVDIIDIDSALPDMAESFGVKINHIAPADVVAQKRQARAQQKQAALAMAAAKPAADAYTAGSKAPEEGSPAKQLAQMVGA